MVPIYRVAIFHLRKVSRFFAWAAKNPLWCSAAAVLAGIFWLQVSFVSSIPDRATEALRNANRFEQNQREQEKMSLLVAALKESVAAYRAAEQFYSSRIADRPVTEPVAVAVLLEGARAAALGREKIALATGAVQGTRFEDARLQAYRSSFEGDLSQLGRMVTAIDEFFRLQLAGQTTTSVEAISSLNSAAVSQHVSAMIMRTTQFGDIAVHIIREQTIEVQEQTAKLKRHGWGFWGFVIGVLYEIAFFVGVGLSIWFAPASARSASSPTRDG